MKVSLHRSLRTLVNRQCLHLIHSANCLMSHLLLTRLPVHHCQTCCHNKMHFQGNRNLPSWEHPKGRLHRTAETAQWEETFSSFSGQARRQRPTVPHRVRSPLLTHRRLVRRHHRRPAKLVTHRLQLMVARIYEPRPSHAGWTRGRV